MSDEDSLANRVEELEERLDYLEKRVDAYRDQYALLITEVGIEALPDPQCPECDDGRLEKRSGVTWSKAVCMSCDSYWYLQGGD